MGPDPRQPLDPKRKAALEARRTAAREMSRVATAAQNTQGGLWNGRSFTPTPPPSATVTAPEPIAPAAPVTPTPPAPVTPTPPAPVTPTPPAAPGTVTVTGNTRPGSAFGQRNYTVAGVVGSGSGMTPGNKTGGFVGAATDAEADRNMQARAAQMQAAQVNIAQMNTAADAVRDLRATKLGVSRNMLDQMEGRAGPSGGGGVVQAPERVSAFAGSGFGDEVLNRDRAERNLNAAKGFGARRKNDRAMQAYLGQLNSADEANEAAQDAFATQQAAALQAGGTVAAAQMRDAGEMRRAQMNQAGDLRRTQMTEEGMDRRAKLTAGTTLATTAAQLQEKRDDNLAKQLEGGDKVIAQMATANPKTGIPDLSYGQLRAYTKQMNPAKAAESWGVSETVAKRIIGGDFTAAEARMLAGAAQSYYGAKANKGWLASDPDVGSF